MLSMAFKESSDFFLGTWDNSIEFNRLSLVSRGTDHQLRLHELVEVCLAQGVQFHGTLLEGQTLLVRILSNLACHVIANLGVKAGDQHESVSNAH